MISWEGKCCQGMKFYGRDRGSMIMGTTGSVLVDPDGYEIYDLKGNKTSEVKDRQRKPSSDLIGSDSMTDAHFANFIAAIRKGEKLNSPVSVGNVAVTMLQLSNIAWEVNRELQLDTSRRKDSERSGSNEVVGARIRERLGAASLGARCTPIVDRHCNQEYPRKDCYDEKTFSRRNFVQSGALIAARMRRFHRGSLLRSNCAGFRKAIADPSGTGQLHLPQLHPRPVDRLHEAAQRHRSERQGRQRSSSH